MLQFADIGPAGAREGVERLAASAREQRQQNISANILTIIKQAERAEMSPAEIQEVLADYNIHADLSAIRQALRRRAAWLIVRRTRLVGPQAELWPDWRYFPFITNRTEALEVVEAEHRQHAVVELTIRDLKDQALAHFPSGQFNANSAWTVIAAIAHNLLRWTNVIGLAGETVRVARTIRRRLLQIPGRLTRTGRQWTLHLPARWPWQHDFTSALARIRSLPELT
jgi:DNA-binding transcriptional MerR regulator